MMNTKKKSAFQASRGNVNWVFITIAAIMAMLLAAGLYWGDKEGGMERGANPVQGGKELSGPSKSFSEPYPVAWAENGVILSLTGVSLGELAVPTSLLTKPGGGFYDAGQQVYGLTLNFKIKVPDNSNVSCVPMSFRMKLNNEGDMAAPNSEQFRFPDTGGCRPRQNITYDNQKVIFIVPEGQKSFTITTGGDSNIFFTVHMEDGELRVVKIPS